MDFGVVMGSSVVGCYSVCLLVVNAGSDLLVVVVAAACCLLGWRLVWSGFVVWSVLVVLVFRFVRLWRLVRWFGYVDCDLFVGFTWWLVRFWFAGEFGF